MSLELNRIFDGAFDTFKVFDNLSVATASETLENTPKNIWQILNHLIIWQAYQITLIQEKVTNLISESESWACKRDIVDQSKLNTAINIFNTQIELIKTELSQPVLSGELINQRIKLFHELALHLSFHLGEIILIRRQLKNYPMPDEMNAFLSTKQY